MLKKILVWLLATVGCTAAPDTPEPTRSASAALSLPLAFQGGVYVPLDNVALSSTNGAVVTANGNAAVSSIGTEFRGASVDGDGNLTSFAADLKLHSAVTLDVGVTIAGEFSTSVALPPLPLPPFEIGPNIVVSPFAYVTFTLEGNADGVAHASVVMPLETGVTLGWTNGQPVFSLASAPPFQPLVGAPDVASALALHLQASAIAGVVFQLTVAGVPIGGPAVQNVLGVGLDVATSAPQWWTATANDELQVGWSFEPTGPGSDAIDLVPPAQWQLASAPGPFPGATSSTRWSRVYVTDTGSAIVAAAPHDGNIATVSARFGAPYTADVNGLGLPVWENAGIGVVDGSDTPRDMVRASNGELTVASAVSGGATRLDRFSPTGAKRWARYTSRATSSQLVGGWNAIAGTPDDGVIVAGSIYEAGKTQLLFARIDSAGSTLWLTKVDPGPGATSPSIKSIALDASGDVLAVGSVVYGDKPNDPTASIDRGNVLLVRLDPAGSLLATRAIGGIGSEHANRVLPLPGGAYAIAGEVPTLGLGRQPHGAWLGLFAADDTITASMTYAGENADLGEGNITGLVAAPAGGFLVSGNQGYQANAWIARLDESGMPVWFKSLRGSRTDTLNGIAALDDGLLAFGGTSSVSTKLPIPATDPWIVRANHDGMVDFLGVGGLDAVNDAVGWQSTVGFVSLPLAGVATPATLPTSDAVLNPAAVTSNPQLLTR